MLVMSQCYSGIVDQGISSPGHGKEVTDGLNDVYKRYIYINWFPILNFLDQTYLVHRLKCTLATKKMM